MRNKSFGKLRLVHCEEPDWFDLLSRVSARELNGGSTSGGATLREDIIRQCMAENPELTYEEAAAEYDAFG
jgi:hypothetical protein